MEKTLSKERQTIFYTDEGKGFPLLLIHGFCEDHTIWNDFKQPFLKNYRIISPDLPGFGKSSLGKSEVGIDDMADAIKAIADKEQLDRFALVGHSMGGYVTLAFAEKYPELLAGFGLFHSICFADDEAKKESRKKVAGFVMKNGSASFVKELYGNLFSEAFTSQNQEMIEALVNYASTFSPEGIANASIAMSRRPDRSNVLEQSKVSVLFILGRLDKVIPVEQGLKVVHLPNTSTIHILEYSAHMGMFEEKEKAQALIREWLDRIA